MNTREEFALAQTQAKTRKALPRIKQLKNTTQNSAVRGGEAKPTGYTADLTIGCHPTTGATH